MHLFVFKREKQTELFLTHILFTDPESHKSSKYKLIAR
jgi:hypothetical protein